MRWHRNYYYTNLDAMLRDVLEQRTRVASVHMSLFTTNEYNEVWVDRVVFDLDYPDTSLNPLSEDGKQKLQQVYEEAKRLYEFLRSRYGVEPVVLFSGRRGFRVEIFCPPILLRMAKETVKTYMEKIKQRVGLTFLDVNVNPRKLVRIPFSKHEITRLHCIPINVEWGIDEVIEHAERGEGHIVNIERPEELMHELLELDRNIVRETHARLMRQVSPVEIRPEGGYLRLPCIQQIMNTILPPRDAMADPNLGGRRMKACKFLAIAYYLDHGTVEGFETLAEVFCQRQNLGHPLRVSECVGWTRWIMQIVESGDVPEWNCAEIREYLESAWIQPLCSPDCPYQVARRRAEERRREEQLRHILRDFNFIRTARRLLDKKVVGETKTKLLLLLVLLGNQNAFVVGDTSTGKTTVVDAVAWLFKRHENDEELICEISAITEKALRWVDRERLPILYLREMPPELARFDLKNSLGMDLKLAMTDHKIVAWYTDTSTRPPTKREKVIYVDAVVWTTTTIELPSDMENRAWVISTDASKEQTEKVVEWKTRRWEDISDIIGLDQETQEEKELIYHAIKFVRNHTPVKIPFASELRKLVNTELPRARRDIDKILELVATVAKTNYYDRAYRVRRTDKIVVIAHPEDTIFALGLIRELFPYMQLGIEKRLKKAYDALVYLYEQNIENNAEDPRVTVAQFATHLNVSQTTARNYLKALVYKGLAREERVGNKNMYEPISIQTRIQQIDFSSLREAYERWWEQYGEYFEPLE